ncbi:MULTISPECIES: RagB/SusD family nutrient uptake outer membrane protein [Olivibacter]|uniref:RagB/SusD family nutrient uptake outer membrane protein n=1 Tax=Olivibacter oleidegradans TaxID=760123 RepID=A0ABV6HHU2_9SPHI|nr:MULTISPECIES: RagB/SusD family nutrient uptake outer membrane protein [Olivibacter]QEL01348.1 RagB/SusD family nutrient uptake outer membrane protein [Olivibacter sp. LS-1]
MRMLNIVKMSKIGLLIMLIITASACKDYLNVQPLDRLTGNNFYQTKEDVEANIANMYSTFFDKINESWVIGAIGEARTGEIVASPGGNSYNERRVVEVLGRNQLLTAINNAPYAGFYNYYRITDWSGYYRVIQSANILIDKLNEGIAALSTSDTQRYLAEATFIRCFTYFWMVRLYGDVVYYTAPYQADPLPREDMVSVLNKCIADLEPHKDNMPWVFPDAAQRGARASKGSIVALLMHMNMWNAGFDPGRATAYYQKVTALGQELVNSGAYRLLDMDDDGWAAVTKGRSEESLFEFYRSINYGDNVSNLAPFGDHFLRWPYKFPRFNNQLSHCYYLSTYMQKLFPTSDADKRKDIWFEDMLADNGQFVARKFGLNVYASGNEDENPDNTFLIFRYADAILLWAEALANLGNEGQAIEAVNMIRTRAGASSYAGMSGTALKDAIFMERSRELFGEGHRYFDLVRTRRIMSSAWLAWPLNQDQFTRRAWTWPVSTNALVNNPYMVLNEYWLPGGGGN